MLNVLRVKNKAIKTAHSDDNGIVLVFIEHVNLILFPFLLFFFVYNEQELLCLVTIIRIFVTHAIDVKLSDFVNYYNTYCLAYTSSRKSSFKQ